MSRTAPRRPPSKPRMSPRTPAKMLPTVIFDNPIVAKLLANKRIVADHPVRHWVQMPPQIKVRLARARTFPATSGLQYWVAGRIDFGLHPMQMFVDSLVA